MHAKSGGSSGEPPDFLFIPAACRSRKDLPRSAGGETGRGTRATVRGTQKTEPRARGAGRGRRGHGRRVRGRGCGVRGAGRGCGTRKTRAWGAGRKTRNAEHVKRGRGHGHGARETGDGAQETGHKPPCMERNATAYAPPGPATTGLDRSQPGAIRRRDQSAGTFHGWTPAAGTRNNPPGPFTAGRHPPPGPATTRRGRSQPGAIRRGPHPTCRAYESESRRCRRARRTCCCRAAPRPT